MQVKQISDNEIYLLIKYIKSVLWSVAKRLFYIEDARCLKFKTLLKHVLDLMFNRICVPTFRTFCPICVQLDVRNLRVFLFLIWYDIFVNCSWVNTRWQSPFILSSPSVTLSWCLLPTANALSSSCVSLPTCATSSCKPKTLNRLLDSGRSKQISTHRCHLTLFTQPYYFHKT